MTHNHFLQTPPYKPFSLWPCTGCGRAPAGGATPPPLPPSVLLLPLGVQACTHVIIGIQSLFLLGSPLKFSCPLRLEPNPLVNNTQRRQSLHAFCCPSLHAYCRHLARPPAWFTGAPIISFSGNSLLVLILSEHLGAPSAHTALIRPSSIWPEPPPCAAAHDPSVATNNPSPPCERLPHSRCPALPPCDPASALHASLLALGMPLTCLKSVQNHRRREGGESKEGVGDGRAGLWSSAAGAPPQR